MNSPLVSSRLYRIGGRIITIAAALACLFQIVLAQRLHRVAADKGPRAVGLLKFGPDGKPTLVPVTIMVDGKFYDASAYKASPVPIALESGTVYEAVRSGVSQGLFSVTTASQGQSTWLGQGTWESDAEIKAAAARKKARDAAKPAKKNEDPQDGPPVLRRAGATKSAPTETSTSTTTAKAPATKASAGPAQPSANRAPTTSATANPSPSSWSDEEDPDRPHLGREKSAQRKAIPPKPPALTGPRKDTHSAAPNLASEGQIVPAISDAAGPEPRSYVFEMKPEEESKLRSTMLSMASPEVAAHAKAAKPEAGAAPVTRATAKKGKLLKWPEPLFEDVRLQAFDLSNSNEPVLILTAKAHMPPSKSTGDLPTDYFVTLVARQDMYAELHKALSVVTDNQHMDTTPRLDLIDAVDIDGDGRGELLFRQVHDRGTAYVVYRVIGNQLWPLYQGAII